MAVFETWVNRDLKKIMTAEDIRGTVFTLDNLGNKIGVRVFSDGQPVTLSGSVNGYCILADGTTVPVAGTRSGNEAYIILPQSAYAVPGMIRIAIKLTDGSAITTLAALIGSVALSRTDNMITPSQQIITDWSQQIAAEMQAVEDASAAQDAKISDLKQALHLFDHPTADVSLFEVGTINVNSGANGSSTSRLRTKTMLGQEIHGFKPLTGYKAALYAYNNGSYVGVWNGSAFAKSTTVGFFTDTTMLEGFPSNYTYRIVLQRTDGEDVVIAEASNIELVCYTVVRYDSEQTLTDGQKEQARDNIGAASENVNQIIKDVAAFSGEEVTRTGTGVITVPERETQNLLGSINADKSCTVKIGGINIRNALTAYDNGTRTKEFKHIVGEKLLAGHTYYFWTSQEHVSALTVRLQSDNTALQTVYGTSLSYSPETDVEAYFRLYMASGYTPDASKVVITIDHPVTEYIAPVDLEVFTMDGTNSQSILLMNYSTIMASDPTAGLSVSYAYNANSYPVNYPYEYQGDKIVLKNKYRYASLGTVLANGGQGGAIFGDLAFKIKTDGTFSVVDMSTLQSAGSGTLPNAPHANTVFFGSQYYDSGDDFPILYINSYVGDELPKGKLYAYRLSESSSVYTATLIQTISIGFVDDTIWTPTGGEYRNSGNFLEDPESGMLWAYTQRSDEGTTRFFSFAMPLITAGDVTLEKTDIAEYFDVPVIGVPQDGFLDCGKIYVLGGASNFAAITVVSTLEKDIVSRVRLYKAGITMEPEMIFPYEGCVYVSGNTMYRIEFD